MLEIAGGIVIGFLVIAFILANANAIPKLIVSLLFIAGFVGLLIADVYLMEVLLGKYKALGIIGSVAVGYGIFYYLQHKRGGQSE